MSALVMQGRDPRTGEVVGDPLAETTPEELDAVLDAAARTASMLRATGDDITMHRTASAPTPVAYHGSQPFCSDEWAITVKRLV